MSVERKERVDVARGDDYEVRERVVEVAPTTRSVLVSRISQLVWLMAAALVAFRFVLLLIGASSASGFASFVYGVTNPFVAPFAGILTLPPLAEGAYVDVASLFAAVVYVLLTWVIVTVFQLIFAERRGVKQVRTVQKTGHGV